MVIRGQSRILQLPCLPLIQHSQRAANFQSQFRNAPHHLENLRKFLALRRLSPRRPHAKSRHPAPNRFSCHRNYVCGLEQPFAPNPAVVMRALRTIATIFRASSGLNRKQLTRLHAILGMELSVHRLRTVYERRQWRPVNGSNFATLPVVPEHRRRRFCSLGTRLDQSRFSLEVRHACYQRFASGCPDVFALLSWVRTSSFCRLV
jgi:hypothetical protein